MNIGLENESKKKKVMMKLVLSKKMIPTQIKSNLPMREKDLLGVVHYDICGPFEVPSLEIIDVSFYLLINSAK